MPCAAAVGVRGAVVRFRAYGRVVASATKAVGATGSRPTDRPRRLDPHPLPTRSAYPQGAKSGRGRIDLGERVWAECGCVHKWPADGSREYWGCPDFATSATLWLTRAHPELSDGRVNSSSGHHGVAHQKLIRTTEFLFSYRLQSGSTLVPSTPPVRISKWRCGPVDIPVLPTWRMACPGVTVSPTWTRLEPASW